MRRPAVVRRPAASWLAALLAVLLLPAAPVRAQELPQLTEPVNDFAQVIDAAHAESLDRTIRALQQATGDVVIVVTVPTFAPYGSLEEYANKLFENHGRGIGEKGKDNGVLVTVAIKEHRVWIEVGYGLEPYITDGFAGETSRLYMIPEFRQGQYGAGIEAGVNRLVGRIAEARNVSIEGVPKVEPRRRAHGKPIPGLAILGLFAVFFVFSILRSLVGGGRRGRWSGWNSGVGPFGGGWGGFGGGFGGGGFGGGGGGFGGFGGGSSGGGGGGGGW